MILPINEIHKTSEWVLKDKRIAIGESTEGEQERAYVANYECSHCLKIYTRFVDETKFNNLTAGENVWEWGWVRRY